MSKQPKERDGGKKSPSETTEPKTIKLNLVISVELEKKFRETIYKKYGMKRGNITKAIEEAINDWIDKQN